MSPLRDPKFECILIFSNREKLKSAEGITDTFLNSSRVLIVYWAGLGLCPFWEGGVSLAFLHNYHVSDVYSDHDDTSIGKKQSYALGQHCVA